MSWVLAEAQSIYQRALEDLEKLVAISSPSGDKEGADKMMAALTLLLPKEATVTKIKSSTEGADDLLVSLKGSGSKKLLLLGHLDTVFSHQEYRPFRQEGDLIYGSGTYDMKGGLVIACGVLRAFAREPKLYQEILLLVVCDEEKRDVPLIHRTAFAVDSVLCFEGGEMTKHDAVVIRRKSANSLNIRASGQASHSGAAIEHGRSALEALALLIPRLSVLAFAEDEELTVTPTQFHAGDAINIVPAYGFLQFDVRAFSEQTARNVLAMVPDELKGVKLEAELIERFPAMDARHSAEKVLEEVERILDRPVLGLSRGGSADINWFKAPVTIDGLGPKGQGDHGPDEHVLLSSFLSQSELALACALTCLRSA